MMMLSKRFGIIFHLSKKVLDIKTQIAIQNFKGRGRKFYILSLHSIKVF